MSHEQEIATLVELLDRAFDKPSWHGPNLGSSLRGVSAERAAISLRGRKTIWEQALHAAYWKQRVLNRVVGTQPFPRPGSNWIGMPAKRTARAWREDIKLLRGIHARLRAGVSKLRPKDLTPKLRRMIAGAAYHDVYHAGQIKLLRRMLG